MESVSIIGLDLAKSIFQAHGNDERGAKLFSKKLRRGELLSFFAAQSPTIVAMEACSSSHYWGREIGALGHQVKLIPAQHVKPFVKRGKNDAADAEAICEAAVRPNMRFVEVKSGEQHSEGMLFHVRDLLVRQRTQLINCVRGNSAEFGVVARVGTAGFEEVKAHILATKAATDKAKAEVPVTAEVEEKEGLGIMGLGIRGLGIRGLGTKGLGKRELNALAAVKSAMAMIETLANDLLAELLGVIDFLDERIAALEKMIETLAKNDKRLIALRTIPGVGPLTALAIKALGPDPTLFASGRDYAAWMGLVPSQNSSGGKERLGKITKKGNRTLRRLLVICAGAHITSVMRNRTQPDPWLKAMLARHPRMKVITAMANKLARIIWAIQVKGGVYQAPTPV
jgi:transposase